MFFFIWFFCFRKQMRLASDSAWDETDFDHIGCFLELDPNEASHWVNLASYCPQFSPVQRLSLDCGRKRKYFTHFKPHQPVSTWAVQYRYVSIIKRGWKRQQNDTLYCTTLGMLWPQVPSLCSSFLKVELNTGVGWCWERILTWENEKGKRSNRNVFFFKYNYV